MKAFSFNNKHSKDLKLIKLFKIPRLFKLLFLNLNFISVGWDLSSILCPYIFIALTEPHTQVLCSQKPINREMVK